MAENSKIEWTDHTFNPWTGCTKVSPGCDHCYAESWAKRSGTVRWGAGQPRRRTTPENWKQPVKWDARAAAEGRRYRVFCASLADVFDNTVEPEWRADLFDLIAKTPNLDWLLLTKRIGNVSNMLPVPFDFERLYPNVWLGATIVNQEEADRDIPKLLATPARVRFLSMEPLLGPVDVRQWVGLECRHEGAYMEGSTGATICRECDDAALLDWVIVGGESGPGSRSMQLQWATDIVQQCSHAGVAVHVKQLGAKPIDLDGQRFPISDRKGGKMPDWPATLRIRELPGESGRQLAENIVAHAPS